MARKVALALLALAALARADGAFVSTQAPVAIPDQRVILVFAEGRERLVIDTAFEGVPGEIAWIVPLPAPATIAPVSPAVFRTIEVVAAPEIENRERGWWHVGAYMLVVVVAVILFPFRVTKLRALAIAVALYLPVYFLWAHSIGVTHGFGVLDRGEIGDYEVATAVDDAGSLVAGLDRNGFKPSAEVRGVLEGHERDGWVFAVARLRSRGSGGRARPLSFEFETKEPVFPLRLTAAQGVPAKLKLHVFSNRRARCDALDVASCFRIVTNEDAYVLRQLGPARDISQPELLDLIWGSTVVTTFRGESGPGAARDPRISFEPYEPILPRVHSKGAARDFALTIGAFVALAALVPCRRAAAWAGERRRRAVRAEAADIAVLTGEPLPNRVPVHVVRERLAAWFASVGIGLLAGTAAYFLTPVAPVRTVTFHEYETARGTHLTAAQRAMTAPTIEAARAAAAATWAGHANAFTGLPVREEASPGNYTIEVRHGTIFYELYDARGAPVSPH